ncbi:MAG: hypothetical protein GPOALKHO_000197 [Sodalis sp.]|uniref:hypothetical protein n=1 Tax=Sodalis sp. (in: enterobacteria) TaxID=1898979 RepID=UPI003872D2CD|nr:MAG: hypothetical protein GPOALKHO_000197 [Sodalis sp.]
MVLMIVAENGEANIVRAITFAPGRNANAQRHVATRNNHRRCVKLLFNTFGIDYNQHNRKVFCHDAGAVQ